jgi:hypothetical protein
MILRWSGSAWTRVTSPAGSDLYGIGFSAAGYGWAVGTTGPASSPKTLILHWNGSSWK